MVLFALRSAAFALLVFPLGAYAANWPPALQRINTLDPQSCSRPSNDYLAKSPCNGDVGAFQVARLGLAVEAFSSALIAAGVQSDQDGLQSALYADVVKFGIPEGMVKPAAALVDIASLKNSPFGAASDSVSGKSLVALEYLYPGIIETSGLKYEDVSRMSGLAVAGGPRDFSAYMDNLSARSAPLDSFRIFGAPKDVAPILQKLTVSPSQVNQLDNRNLASDFIFPKGIDLENTRGVPVAAAIAGIAGKAQATGIPLDKKLFPVSSGTIPGANFLGDTPFHGAACLTCVTPGNAPATDPAKEALLSGGMPISLASQFVTSSSPSTGRITDGMSLLAAERDSSLARSGSNSIGGQRASSPEKSDGISSGQTSSGWTAKTLCEPFCALREAVVASYDLAGGIGKANQDLHDKTDGAGHDAAAGIDQARKTLTSYYDCVETCKSDIDLAKKKADEAHNGPKVAPGVNTGTDSGGATGGTPAGTSGGGSGDNGKPKGGTTGGNDGNGGGTSPRTPTAGKTQTSVTSAGETRMTPSDDASGGPQTRPGPKLPAPSCIAATQQQPCYCNVSRDGEIGSCDHDTSHVSEWAFGNAPSDQPSGVFVSRGGVGNPPQRWTPDGGRIPGLSNPARPGTPGVSGPPSVDPRPPGPLDLGSVALPPHTPPKAPPQ